MTLDTSHATLAAETPAEPRRTSEAVAAAAVDALGEAYAALIAAEKTYRRALTKVAERDVARSGVFDCSHCPLVLEPLSARQTRQAMVELAVTHYSANHPAG
jgi:LDH2 family malate/lactate/ureidoglycolate dehydrogenase